MTPVAVYEEVDTVDVAATPEAIYDRIDDRSGNLRFIR